MGRVSQHAVAAVGTAVVTAAGIGLAACGAARLPDDGPALARAAQADSPGTTAADVLRGRQAFVERCTGCHRLYAPAEFNAATWAAVLPPMYRKAKVDANTAADITRYVNAALALEHRATPAP